MEERRYVTEFMGEELLQWKEGDKVVISTPTGSGKTTYVIQKLLKHAVSLKKHVVYYCNRKVLHDQFSMEAKKKIQETFLASEDLVKEAEDYLHILTYQSSELSRNYPTVAVKIEDSEERVSLSPTEILYYVFDEAHYFVSDALINHGTNFWYDQRLNYGISVFLTATPKPLFCFLEQTRLMSADKHEKILDAFKKRDEYKSRIEEIISTLTDMLQRNCKEEHLTLRMPEDDSLIINMKRGLEDPLAEWFELLKRIEEGEHRDIHLYQIAPSYDYVKPIYFWSYTELLEEMRDRADEKWLIFVDREDDGKTLERYLRENRIAANFLSRRSIECDEAAGAEYISIVMDEKFWCDVLIATSVLDCGINIKDDSVKNVVIASDNETTFLQMLGRKRRSQDEFVRLYIKVLEYKTIHHRYWQGIQAIRFLVEFSQKNRSMVLRVGKGTSWSDGDTHGSVLSAGSLDKLIDAFWNRSNKTLVKRAAPMTQSDYYGHILDKREEAVNNELFLREFAYSRSAFLHIVEKLYNYTKAFDSYRSQNGNFKKLCEYLLKCLYQTEYCHDVSAVENHFLFFPAIWSEQLSFLAELERDGDTPNEIDLRSDTERDSLFYLKYQLKWIGKEYDEHNWIRYEQRRGALTGYLESMVGSEKLLRQDDKRMEQEMFSRQCVELICNLPVIPRVLRKDASRYRGEQGKYLGKNRLNKYFVELGLPYRIDSVQKKYEGVSRKKTCWIIVRI